MWTLTKQRCGALLLLLETFLFYLPFSVTVVDMLAVRTSSDSLTK